MQKYKLYFLIFFLLISNNIFAQNSSYIKDAKCDNIWLLGYASFSPDSRFGCTKINFQNSTLIRDDSRLDFSETIATICDTTGNLLFYTNGVMVGNKNLNKMQGSDTLNPGYFSSYNWNGDGGYRTVQGALILPFPNHPNIYYLFHVRDRNPTFIAPTVPDKEGLYYTTIDMTLNNGLGRVTSLRNPIIQNDSLDGRLLACRHANGRDWWVLVWNFRSGEYRSMLFDPQGVHISTWRSTVAQRSNFNLLGNIGQSAFSPDGSKFATNINLGENFGNYVSLYDFDRCEGIISNPQYFHFNDSLPTGGVAFSPNSRYIYLNSAGKVYQHDLTQNPPIDTTAAPIAEWDGFMELGQLATLFYLMQNTPDGRIFISSPNGVKHLHSIENPNEAGLACNIQQHSIETPTFNFAGIPNLPNFRLGPVDGSVCDTLGINNPVATQQANEKKDFIKVFPNPASGILNIECADFQNKQLILTDVLGRVQKVVSLQSETSNINTQNLPNGIYYLTLYDENKPIYTTKLVVLHE